MSTLLDQASLVVIPSGYKEDTVYSQKPTDGSGDLTFTRASDGTRVNSQGLVERVPWNLLQQSQSFSTSGSVWNYTAGSGVITGQTGYDGTTNAVLFTDSGANPVYGAYQGFTKLGSVTLSIYAKAGSTNIFYIDIFQTPLANVKVNLSTGAITSGSGVVENVGNGWYRISVTAVMTDSYYVRFGCPSTGNVYIQNIQANEGSTAKPYFPTTDRLNVPRLDYSNGCPSLLLEPQRTNLVTYSEQFDNAAWTKSLCTITANQIVSPSGYLDADLVTTSGTSDSLQQSVSVTSGTTYTFSAFVKNDSAGTIGLVVFSSFPTSVGTYNLTNGTATSGTGSPVVSIQNYGNGWYRATLTATATSTGTANFYFSSTSPDAVSTYYIWGAQIEAGSYPTSYIPTTSASVTRVADEAYKTGISSLIGQTEGTLFAEFDIESSVNTEGYIARIDTTSFNDTVFMVRSASGSFTMALRSGGSYIAQSSTASVSGRNKAAIAYKSGEFAFYLNGTQVGTSTATYTNGITYDDFRIGGFFSSVANMAGEIAQAVLFKTRLTNAELASLTTL